MSATETTDPGAECGCGAAQPQQIGRKPVESGLEFTVSRRPGLRLQGDAFAIAGLEKEVRDAGHFWPET